MVTGLDAPFCAAADNKDEDDWPMLRGGATPMRAPLAPTTSERARGTLPSLRPYGRGLYHRVDYKDKKHKMR